MPVPSKSRYDGDRRNPNTAGRRHTFRMYSIHYIYKNGWLKYADGIFPFPVGHAKTTLHWLWQTIRLLCVKRLRLFSHRIWLLSSVAYHRMISGRNDWMKTVPDKYLLPLLPNRRTTRAGTFG